MAKKYSPLVLVFLSLILLSIFIAPSFYPKKITVIVPFDGTLFPADMSPALFAWSDSSKASMWKIEFKTADNKELLKTSSDSDKWYPDVKDWISIKKASLDKDITVDITGYNSIIGINLRRSSCTFKIRTSADSVSAPVFFRSVTLPFEYANKHMDSIKWCIGDISSGESPRVVLENMPVCGNCHSFTSDGKTIGMDVDYANDKGSYIITNLKKDMVLEKDEVITWSNYKAGDKEMTFGLLSSLSPDGRYAISTVKDRSVFVPKDDLNISQLFFPLKGILVYYDRQTKKFNSLPGADDKKYVQSNPTWSPDSKTILFTKSLADSLKKFGNKVVLTKEQCDDYLVGGKKFRYDIYRIPFNDGKGGEAVPLEGASGDNKSNYFPRYSPDGKWIIFCKADSFMLLQPDSRLYIIPSEGGTPRLMNCNRNMMNSWHSWSPNGKWLVFSSKNFSPYTQLFLTHIDEKGNDTPPVFLSSFIFPERAANIPEFLNNSPDCIAKISERFMDDYSFYRSGLFFEDYFKDFDKAEKDFKASLALNPKNAQVHLSLGKLYLDKKDYSRAEKEYFETLKINPSDHFAHNELGLIYKSQGKLDLAEKEFQNVLKIKPDNFFAHHNLGYMYIQKKEYDKAEKIFLNLIKIIKDKSKTDPDVVTSATSKDYVVRSHAGLANIYLLKKKYDDGIREFKIATEIQPNNALAHMSLGDAYYNSGKLDMALKEYDISLSLNPSNDTLRRDVEKIRQMTPQ